MAGEKTMDLLFSCGHADQKSSPVKPEIACHQNEKPHFIGDGAIKWYHPAMSRRFSDARKSRRRPKFGLTSRLY